MSSFDIRANLHSTVQGEQERENSTTPPTEATRRSFWRNAVLVNTAHVQQFARDGVIDEQAFAAIARALDSVYQAQDTGRFRANDAMRQIDERVDALLPRDISGGASLGMTRVEMLATAMRMTWRDHGLSVLQEAAGLRAALLDLANAHAVTIMAAVWERRPATPTTLAHFLGGAIGPLAQATGRLKDAILTVDRSPFGAGVLAGEVMAIDRADSADTLGFGSTIENTLDALSSVEDFVGLLEAVGANLAASRRLFSELLTWIRTEPTSFFVDERWESNPEPSMPAHTASARLETLVLDLAQAEGDIRSAIDLLRSLPYGPLGSAWDAVEAAMNRALTSAEAGMQGSSRAINEALIVNRAYLANRAGRMYTTAADLAPFLMQEEQLPPTVARQISSLVISRLREEHLEASAVTQDIIDSAALMVIGRELKVEMETLGRYLAPRRFIERRDVAGSPAPERTRAWLAMERQRLHDDRSWAEEVHQRWEASARSLLKVLASASAEDD